MSGVLQGTGACRSARVTGMSSGISGSVSESLSSVRLVAGTGECLLRHMTIVDKILRAVELLIRRTKFDPVPSSLQGHISRKRQVERFVDHNGCES